MPQLPIDSSSLISIKIQQFMGGYFGSPQLVRGDRKATFTHINMVSNDPVIRFCVENTLLYLFSIFGEYEHPRNRIKNDIRESIVTCIGSWRDILKRILSCYWLGYSWTEVAFIESAFNRLSFSELNTLSPTLYTFEGSNYQVKDILIYQDGLPVRIPYGRGLHFVIGSELNFDLLHGCGRCQTIAAYHELHIILMGVLAVAAQRQATPILVKKTDLSRDVELIDPVTGQVRLNPNGEPETISSGFDAIQQLSAIAGSGVTVIDTLDDLYQIEPKVANDFLMAIIKFIEGQKMMGFLVPQLVGSTSASGLGDSTLGSSQLDTFHLAVKSMGDFLNEQLIDGLIRPQIIYNFGEQASYGYFDIRDPNVESMQIADRLIACFANGTFNKNDLDAFNRIRMILKIDTIDDSYFLPTLTKNS